MSATRLHGMFAALMTALDDAGDFSEGRQRGLTDAVLGQGLAGLYVGGSSGESGLLESDVLLAQQAIVAERAKGRGAVLIAHVGVPSLSASVALARNAERLGYEAISALPPHAYPFSDAEILGYYRQLAAATSLPLIVYEIPIRTNRPLPLEFLVQLLELPGVAGIKFTSTDIFKLSQLRRHCPQSICYFGFDEIFLAAAALGVEGGIGTTYNILGRLYVALDRAVRQGDLATARRLQGLSQEFVDLLLVTGVLPGMKAAFRLRGVDCGPTRLPLAPRVADPEAVLRPFLDRPDVAEWLAGPA